MITCVVGGGVYESRPEPYTNGNGCSGCVAERDAAMCQSLPTGCSHLGIIWVKPAPSPTQETLRKMRTGGSFATHIAEAYEVADSGNARILREAFADLFKRFS